ncbi:MCE family protein, partial [Nocardia salmonicida]|uniref:MCE family protein n=1 Tax=Nocardia salmonicida TaxID=53431 RepID=UPI00340282BB
EGSLQTVVSELGLAFAGTGDDLGQIIDTSNRFIEAADANFEVTTALIRDANTVLKGQLASASAIRGFAEDLSLFSTTLAGSDADVRRLIDSGGATATLLREFLEKNQVEITDLLNNLVTTGEVVVRHLDGVEMILVVYPYVVESGFSVAAKDPITGIADAHFGLVLTSSPAVCHKGYEGTTRRSPQERFEDLPMEMGARCAEPASKSNARGAQNAPRPPVVATYDQETGELTWLDEGEAAPQGSDGLAPKSLGQDPLSWLMLRPLAQ